MPLYPQPPPQVSLLPAGPTANTARLMMRFALDARKDYRVRELAESITSRIADRDQLSEALACYYWVLMNVRYLNSQWGIELQRDPGNMLRPLPGNSGGVHQGDCNEMGPLLAALLMCLGREVRFVTVGFDNSGEHSHTFPEVLVGGRWLCLDPVANTRTGSMLRRVRGATPFYANDI